MRSWKIGRSPDCDLTINHALVSSVHAVFEDHENGSLRIRDNQSTNGTYLNDTSHRIEETEVQDDDILFFSKQYSLPVAQIRRRLGEAQPQGTQTAQQQTIAAGSAIRIGRASDNDVVIPSLSVSRYHAEITQLPGGRLQLRDLNSKAGVLVDDRLIRGETIELSPDQTVRVCGTLISLGSEGGSAVSGEPGLRVGVERERLFLHARDLGFHVRGDDGGKQPLIRDFETAIYPGEFIGILGPSGCGKTTVLELLAGIRRPSAGTVYFNGLDLNRNLQHFAPAAGFVPQYDQVHPGLTARETLYYSARLRLPPDVSDGEIHEKIDRLCVELGLWKPESGEDARNVLVGSNEKKGLSGGQRKRVSLAIELITDPQLLFLDEPTSGLSSQDTRAVMESMFRLSRQRGIAILITIHQPSPRVYRLMDKTVYLKRGRLCYFGPSCPESIQFFCGSEEVENGGPDDIMERLDDMDEEAVSASYRSTPEYQTLIRERCDRLDSLASQTAGERSSRTRWCPWYRQLQVLVERQLKCTIREYASLGLLLLQAPLVAALFCLIFSDELPGDRLSVLFLLGFVSIWFGMNNSAREIVGERHIYRREKRGGLSSIAYVLSKLTVQGFLSLFQCAFLVAVVTIVLNQIELGFLSGLIICWTASLAGVTMGLAISAFARTEIAAIVSVPLVLIPVILLGGLIKPYPEFSEAMKNLADLTPARWSFEALVSQAEVVDIFEPSSATTSLGVLFLFVGVFFLAALFRARKV